MVVCVDLVSWCFKPSQTQMGVGIIDTCGCVHNITKAFFPPSFVSKHILHLDVLFLSVFFFFF